MDDEFQIIAAIRRNLLPQSNSWDMKFASTAEHALLTMAEHSIDVVVTDMRMP